MVNSRLKAAMRAEGPCRDARFRQQNRAFAASINS